MATLTVKRFLQEVVAFSLHLCMIHCFCSTLLFSSNYSIGKGNSSLLKRFLFPYSVDSYSSVQFKHTGNLTNEMKFSNIFINVILMSLFALQHSLMAHSSVRRYLQKSCTKAVERAVYIAASSLILHFVYIFWRPISRSDSTLYHLPPIIGRAVDFLFICGVISTCLCIFEAWYYDQFGIRTAFTGEHFCQHPSEQLTGFHKFVRQPVFGAQIFGLLMAKQMSFGRFLFVACLCVYTYIGVIHHEKAIEKEQGSEMWQLYKETTSTFFPLKRYFFAAVKGKAAVNEWTRKRNELYERQRCTKNRE